ncbi:lantibiotic dehydratase [Clostridium felsineum]|uniref:lantibiotic dehydratase n=1 Tax=Clostridium felsineum TaxID=36839 RepID=UPI00098CAB4F|nr:lantibiotic dehydratase [Clostridium felsineum]URZ14285.1 hypothetical protein CLFE_002700 [Clostridium felsineum DSM 794]
MSTDDRIITKRVYKPLDFFMIRTPLLPINSYDNIFNNDLDEESIIKELIKISKDPIIRESIAVASLDLLNSLDKLETCKNKKEKNQIISSLLKYFIRMTTRTTPFGEFSGVTLGKFSEKTDIGLESIHNFIKRARPDMEWIYKLINVLEKDKEILNNLIICWNSIVSFVGSRIEIPYLSIYTQENSEDNEEEFLKSIFSWKAEWNVPKYVYQVEADNRLMFNLENKVHIKELLNILKKKKNIMIQAVECDFDNCFVYNEKGKYVSEIVVPIIKNNIKTSSNKFNFNIKECNIDTLDSRRIFSQDQNGCF